MKKVVVIGGGTGNFTVLRGLRKYGVELSAIVSMADDGGSTGVLRDELGVLPPGDVRQCLVALSDSSRMMRSLMNYRFENGGLEGHSFGNLLLSALEKVTGSFEQAIEEAGRILSIKGKVIPVTTHKVKLKMLLTNNTMLEGEDKIDVSSEIDQGYSNLFLEPYPKADPHAISEIMNADVVLLGPGSLYTSLIPNLLVEGIAKALRETKAKKIFVANLMNKKGQTTNFKVSDYLREVTRYLGKDVFDYVFINDGTPAEDLIDRYAKEGELVTHDLTQDPRAMTHNFLEEKMTAQDPNDPLASNRSLIRHDAHKLAAKIMEIVERVHD